MIFSTTKSRRQKLRSTPFSPEWREILHRRFPLLACLPPEDQRELERHDGKAEGRRMNDEGGMP
jgi:Mlc titration factor MtfA (ptsG expression regulator)